MDVPYLFAGIGAIILMGFMGSLLFERTKIPDILILIFIGLIIGPILTTYTDIGILDDPEISGALTQIAPMFSALALVIILFDGGLNLNLEKTMQKLGTAIVQTGIAFIGTMFVTAIVCFYFLNMEPVMGLLLGCVLGGVSSAVVIPIMASANVKEDTKVILTLESVLTDVLCIVIALILIEILIGGSLDTGGMIQQLLTSFVLAGFIAFLFGVFWLWVLKRLEGKPFSFMITIAALLVLYAMTEFIHVSGAIAALVFGLVLSNKDEIARILKIKGSFVFDEHIKQFHSELSFLIRTFFFVYLGITFVFTIGSGSISNLPWFLPAWLTAEPLYVFIFLLSIIFIGIFIMRYIAATVTVKLQPESKEDKSYIYAMIPRGLAAAVLAQLPFTIPEFSDTLSSYYIKLSSYGIYVDSENVTQLVIKDLFLTMAFMMIVLTVIVTTIGVSIIERKRASGPDEPEPKEEWADNSLTYRKAKDAHKTTNWERETPIKPRHKPVIKHAPPPKQFTPIKQVSLSKQSGPVRKHPQPAKKYVPAPAKDHHPLVKRASAAKKTSPKVDNRPKRQMKK